jgi:hypothetical protein
MIKLAGLTLGLHIISSLQIVKKSVKVLSGNSESSSAEIPRITIDFPLSIGSACYHKMHSSPDLYLVRVPVFFCNLAHIKQRVIR